MTPRLRRPALAAVLTIALAWLCAYALMGAPFYHTNDDPVMSCIVAGAGWIGGETHPDEHAVFIHVLLGRVLVALYRAWPALPWYGLMLLTAVALAAAVLAFAGLRVAPSGFVAACVTCLAALAACEGWAHLHFGISATLLATAGVTLGLSLVVRPAASPRATAGLACGALALALLADLLRPEGAWLGLVASAPLAVLVLARRRRAAAHFVGALCVFGALHAGAYSWQRAAYAAAPGWEQTLDWMAAKTAFVDHARIAYTPKTRAAFAAAGWSGNDLELLRRWFAWDAQLYSAASMRALEARLHAAGVVPAHNLEWPRLRQVYRTPLALAAVALALAVGLGLPRREALALACACALIGALLFGLGAFLRTPPLRVHMPAWLLACVAPVFWLALREPSAEARAGLRRRVSRCVTLATLMTLAWVEACDGHVLAAQRSHWGRAARRDLERLQIVAARALYLNWAGLFPMHELVRPLEPFVGRPSGTSLYAAHSFFWIGWPARLPINRLWLARHGVNDLYPALWQRDDLILLTQPRHLPVLQRFLLEHRGLRLGSRLVMVGETVSAYRLVAAAPAP